jgi:hypothetical protein
MRTDRWTEKAILIVTPQACKYLQKAAVAYFNVTTQHFFEQPTKPSKALRQISRPQKQKSNPALPESETEVIATCRDVWFLKLKILRVVFRQWEA